MRILFLYYFNRYYSEMTRLPKQAGVKRAAAAARTTTQRIHERIERMENQYDNQRFAMALLAILLLCFSIASLILRLHGTTVRAQPQKLFEQTAQFVQKARSEKQREIPYRNRYQLAPPGNRGGYFNCNQQWIYVDESGALMNVQWE